MALSPAAAPAARPRPRPNQPDESVRPTVVSARVDRPRPGPSQLEDDETPRVKRRPRPEPEEDDKPRVKRRPRPNPEEDEKPRVKRRPNPEPEEQDLDETQPDREPKRKKKKKRRKKRRDPGDLRWLWWVGGLAGFLLLALIAVVLAVRAGYTAEVIGYSIWLGVMIPVSAVILIVSMVLSSSLSGGINFGEVHTAILKTVALLLVVNVLSLVPFGYFLALPIWVFGLMYLFDLDLWETRFLVAINWLLNALVRYFFFAMVLAALAHQQGRWDREDQSPPGWSTSEEESVVDVIEAMGGTYEPKGTDTDAPVVRVSFAGKPISDAELSALVQLKGLASLQALDLSGTRITDAGLASLKGLRQLQTLVLNGTRVTDAGVADLRRALPGLKISR